jgi:hypothetical protein
MLQMLILDVANCGPHHPDKAIRPDVRALATPLFNDASGSVLGNPNTNPLYPASK